MAFPIQTVTYGDHEINELIRSSSPPRDYEYQSNTPRALPDSSDNIEKMKSLLGALMRSEKPASKDKNMKQLNSLIRKLGTGKNGQRKKTTKRRSVSDQEAPSKSSEDIQRAASETEEVDVVPVEESKLSPIEEDNPTSSEEEKAIQPKKGNSEPSEGENLTPTKEDQSPPKKENLESPEEEKQAQPDEDKLAPPKQEKEKADLKEPEENSKVGQMEILNLVYDRLSSLVDSKKKKNIFNFLNDSENEKSPIFGI